MSTIVSPLDDEPPAAPPSCPSHPGPGSSSPVLSAFRSQAFILPTMPPLVRLDCDASTASMMLAVGAALARRWGYDAAFIARFCGTS
jgi:hypothetical protein